MCDARRRILRGVLCGQDGRTRRRMRIHPSIVIREANKMTNDKIISRKWYSTLAAGLFLMLCGISSIRYIAMDISLIERSVPITTQVVCFAATFAAALYFFRPLFGCVGLLAICCYGLLLSAQAADAKAVVFYVIVLFVLASSLRDFRNQRPATGDCPQ